jgi:fermentation-respiration switch protein FrsA (DUF1100 family)
MSIPNSAARTDSLIKNTQDLEFRRHDVDFPSCGATLRGQLLVPKTEGRHAAIAMAPGMSGVKEGSIMKFAEFFASGGFAVLAYDNINFGSSGGDPRQEVDPILQRRGYRDAITFLALRPEIDGDRIGIFGTSYSGGHVLEVAAHDRRVKCVVSQIPAISGFEAFSRSVRPDARAAVLGKQNKDRESRFLGLDPVMVRAVSDDPSEFCAMPGKASFDYFMEQARVAPNWRNELTLRSMDLYRGIDNAPFVPWISPTPLLMIVALGDEVTPPDLSLDAYSKAKEPKKLVLLPGNHFTPYSEEFALAGNEARDWFTRHLVVGGSAALN